MPIPKPLRDLLSLPTAAYLEAAVLAYLERECRKLPGVSLRYDRYRNLLAHYRHRPRGITPFVFVAHMDHPAFAALEMLDRRTLRAAFRGGVRVEYFDGARVRFWTGDGWVRGRVQEVTKLEPVPGWTGRPEEVLIRVPGPVPQNAPGVWDLPEPFLRGDIVHAPGCDDVAGTAAMLALLQRLSRRRVSGEVYCLFTRAEEVGFIGAIGAARAGTIPKRLPVISIETSSELPGVQIGAGPILRVGDRAAIFTPALTAACQRVAENLRHRRKTFRYQRKLMDGGVCEAYPFLAYGYAATGICVALGNYHNMDTRRQKIASEYISVRDWLGMVDWFEALVRDERGPVHDTAEMRAKIDPRFDAAEHMLLQ